MNKEERKLLDLEWQLLMTRAALKNSDKKIDNLTKSLKQGESK